MCVELVKPSFSLFLVSVAVFFLTLYMFVASGIDFALPFTDRSGDRNMIGFIIGSFSSTGILGIFLKEDNKRRSTFRYVDWSLISPRVLIPCFTLLSWLMGLLHVFFFAKELTRA
jgi:hypothetical protein